MTTKTTTTKKPAAPKEAPVDEQAKEEIKTLGKELGIESTEEFAETVEALVETTAGEPDTLDADLEALLAEDDQDDHAKSAAESDVLGEVARTLADFEPLELENGTGGPYWTEQASRALQKLDKRKEQEAVTWLHVFDRGAKKVLATVDPAEIRAALLQHAAETVAWIVNLDKADE